MPVLGRCSIPARWTNGRSERGPRREPDAAPTSGIQWGRDPGSETRRSGLRSVSDQDVRERPQSRRKQYDSRHRREQVAFRVLRRYAEVIILRAAPGLLNLATMLLIGGWMTPGSYGLYSTALATTTLVGTLVFGPFISGVVSQHAKLEAKGLAQEYESALISAVLILGLIVSLVGITAWFLGVLHWAWIGPVVAIGVYAANQEVLRARLQIRSFGALAVAQAVAFMVLAAVLVRPVPEPERALTAFALSYALAATASIVLSGVFAPRWPAWAVLFGTLRVGGVYTVSSTAEYGLYLGMRYVFGYFGGAEHLGVFSFCVDIAQRTVGFLVNAASFIVVPAAFKADAERGGSAFRDLLVVGCVQALGLSLLCFAAVFLLRETGLVAALQSALFHPRVFAVVALAVVLNRVKKMILDPFALRMGRASMIAIGYGMSAPITLLIAAVGLERFGWGGIEGVYLGGYVLSGAITLWLYTRRARATNTSRRETSVSL